MSSSKIYRRSLGAGLLATVSVVAVSSGLTAFQVATASAGEHRQATVYRSTVMRLLWRLDRLHRRPWF